ncbi:MAG TPA: STAS domain-containing protein [Phycisphaerae bacterium]|nr:STAS domain-containing protein [Phycisphaerae bacterium]
MSSRFDLDGEDLVIESRREGDTTVVALRGEVTVFSSPALRERLHRIAGEHPGRIVMDLAETTYVDSSGVATFVEVLKMVRRHEGDLVLAGISDRVRGVFEIARLADVFHMAPSVEEALEP